MIFFCSTNQKRMIKCPAVATIKADASISYLSRVIVSARRLRTKETNN